MTDDQTLLDLAGRATPRKPYAFHSLSACADEAIENASQGEDE